MEININDIKIPPSWSSYSDAKFENKEKLYAKTGSPGKITLNKNNVLIDGYISYLVYKKHGVEQIDVCVPTDEKKLYVYGTHPNSPCKKEYMWEVPKKIENKFLKRVHPESRIYCHTRFGIAPVIVSRIEWSDEDFGASVVANY